MKLLRYIILQAITLTTLSHFVWAQSTGVMLGDDVCVSTSAAIGVHGPNLTLTADLLGSGEVIMADTHQLQTIDARGHSLPQLTVQNPKGILIRSDFEVTNRLRIVLGVINLDGHKLFLSRAEVLDANSRNKVLGGIIIIKNHFSPDFASSPCTSSIWGGELDFNEAKTAFKISKRFPKAAFASTQSELMHPLLTVCSPPPEA